MSAIVDNKDLFGSNFSRKEYESYNDAEYRALVDGTKKVGETMISSYGSSQARHQPSSSTVLTVDLYDL